MAQTKAVTENDIQWSSDGETATFNWGRGVLRQVLMIGKQEPVPLGLYPTAVALTASQIVWAGGPDRLSLLDEWGGPAFEVNFSHSKETSYTPNVTDLRADDDGRLPRNPIASVGSCKIPLSDLPNVRPVAFGNQPRIYDATPGVHFKNHVAIMDIGDEWVRERGILRRPRITQVEL